MLTKTDLNQIRGIVHEEVDVVVDEKLEPIKKDLKTLRKDVKYLKKTADIVVANYDEADVKLERRVNKIERHLALEA